MNTLKNERRKQNYKKLIESGVPACLAQKLKDLSVDKISNIIEIMKTTPTNKRVIIEYDYNVVVDIIENVTGKRYD